jgi:hypothetical protein
MANVEFSWDTASSTALQTRFQNLPEEIDVKMVTFLEQLAPKAETEMKVRAPWRNWTWDARNGLFVEPVVLGLPGGVREYSLIFGHTVDYGIYLETIVNGKYQIIMPMVKATGETIMQALGGLLGPYGAMEIGEIKPELYSGGTSETVGREIMHLLRNYKRNVKQHFGNNAYYPRAAPRWSR